MRKSPLKVYAPFLALALVQAALVVTAPSKGSTGQEVATFSPDGGFADEGAGGFTTGEGFAADTSGSDDPAAPADSGTTAVPGSDAGATSGANGAATGATGADTGGGGGAGGSSTPGGGGPEPAADGTTGGATGDGAAAPARVDTSHCQGDLQFKILINGNPPCVPKFTGDNGGATAAGVTGDAIKIIYFSSEPNPQVDAILAQQGLVVPEDQLRPFLAAAVEFVNKRYELYGRKVVLERVVGDCPTTPPDYAACNAAARRVAEKRPFMIIWNTPLYASVFDIWARAGIVSAGGWHFENSFFAGRRPYRYDTVMQGTELAGHISEYYCKKLAGGTATHSGRIIHPQIGPRGQVQRKLGIVVPEIPANVRTAQQVQQAVAKCDPDRPPEIFTYVSDIERATEQTEAVVSGLIDSGATTVTCMCDPIAPAFLTAGMTQQGYFPEHLVAGTSFIDYDLIGRLYDKQQWQHAFGVSPLPVLYPVEQNDAARVWRDVGREGHPCGENGCGSIWAYFGLLGSALHLAGPDLNPLTFEQALLTKLPPHNQGGKIATLVKFGPGDYTAQSDVKEVYWSHAQASPVDGEPGTYVPLNDGRRYQLGKWPGGFTQGIPVAAS